MRTRIKKTINRTEKGTINVFIVLILVILLFTVVPFMIIWDIASKSKRQRT